MAFEDDCFSLFTESGDDVHFGEGDGHRDPGGGSPQQGVPVPVQVLQCGD